jgi:hypothetical protein
VERLAEAGGAGRETRLWVAYRRVYAGPAHVFVELKRLTLSGRVAIVHCWLAGRQSGWLLLAGVATRSLGSRLALQFAAFPCKNWLKYAILCG